jgi:hypothetical protein
LRDQITDRRALRNALIVVAIAAVTGSVASDANAHSLSAQKQLRTAPAAKNAKKEIDGGRFDHKQRKIVRNKLSESTHWTSTVSRTIERDDGDGANSGIASIYSDTQTASGEAMSAGAMTAAHRTLPFGTPFKRYLIDAALTTAPITSATEQSAAVKRGLSMTDVSLPAYSPLIRSLTAATPAVVLVAVFVAGTIRVEECRIVPGAFASASRRVCERSALAFVLARKADGAIRSIVLR